MTLNNLINKVLPTLVAGAIIVMYVAVVELQALSIKVGYLEQIIISYHSKD